MMVDRRGHCGVHWDNLRYTNIIEALTISTPGL